MPLYEYQCTKCHKRTEKIENVAGPHLKKCPHCGGKVERLQSAPAIQFKGCRLVRHGLRREKIRWRRSASTAQKRATSKETAKETSKETASKESASKETRLERAPKKRSQPKRKTDRVSCVCHSELSEESLLDVKQTASDLPGAGPSLQF